ncbi:AAA family ATPase, partial [Limosilactobacillus sp.]|uniref:AAA family ATPase n=1 Tax=Limosilactobacillus sp. TaxID=2773925 RepID=UPI003EFDAC8B
IFKLIGKDMSNPRDYNEVKRHVAARNNRLVAGWGKQNDLFKASEYINGSLYSGDQRLDFSFKNWQTDMQPQNVAGAKSVGNKCYVLAKKMINQPMKVLLSGPPGTGKTSLAMAILNYLAGEGFTVMTVSTMELQHLLDSSYKAEDAKDKLDYTEKLMKTADVLLLDDLGTEGGMKHDIQPVRKTMQELMFRVANARLDLKRNEPVHSIIVTTNCTTDELAQMYNEKIISRLVPHNRQQIVDFNGLQDVRK